MHAVKHTTARPPCSGHLQHERKKRTAKPHEAMEDSNMHAVKHTTARPPCSGHLQLERKKGTAKSHEAPDNNKRQRWERLGLAWV